MNKLFGNLFILTGIFAIVGGGYTWGDGIIFNQNQLIKVWIPWADVLLTGPLSIICGIGIFKNLSWAKILGVATSGIYVFGSIMVFISIVWDKNYSIYLIMPAVCGLLIGVSYIFHYLIKHPAVDRGPVKAD